MTPISRLLRPVAALLAAAALTTGAAAAETVAYPTPAEPSFMLDYPSSWQLEPGAEEGDYFSLTGSTGAELWLRTLPATSGDLSGAVQETIDYLSETYENVELGEPVDATGPIEGFSASGTGTSEGENVVFGVGWFLINDSELAEVWFVTSADDTAGAQQAQAILGSFRVP